MRDINISLYKFNELSKDVQDKVIQRYRNYELDGLLYENLEDIMKREFNDKVDNLDFDLSYSLNSCQGDGVSFDGTVKYKDELLTLALLVYNNRVPKNILRLIERDIIYSVEFTRNSHYYVHKYTVTISIIDNYNTNKDYCHISRAIADFEKAINKWYLNICDDLEKFGYITIENMYSDDNITSFIEANEYEFFIDGRAFL